MEKGERKLSSEALKHPAARRLVAGILGVLAYTGYAERQVQQHLSDTVDLSNMGAATANEVVKNSNATRVKIGGLSMRKEAFKGFISLR